MSRTLLETTGFDINNDGTLPIVLIYFNHFTEKIDVYTINNNVETPVNGGQNRGYWDSNLEGRKSNVKHCDGTTRFDFYYQESYPYYRIDKVLGGCSQNVCQIDILTPIAYTEESALNAGDGSVRIKAFSPDGAIEYSLNNVVYQLSNEFTGLTAGSYVAYARLRDNTECFDKLDFTLPKPVDYSDKFTYTFVNDRGDSCVLTISERGYTGSVSIKNWATPSPLLYQFGKKGKGKFEPITPSTLTFNPFSETDFEWEDFQNADDFTYKAKLEVGGVVYFEGYVLTQLHKEPYKLTPYPNKITCSDGLVLLKQFSFSSTDGTQVKGRISLATAVYLCIRKLNLKNYFFADCIDLLAEDMNTTRTTYSALVGLTFTESASEFGNLTLTGSTDYTTNFPVNSIVDLVNNDYGYINDVRVLASNYEDSTYTLTIDYPYSQASNETWRVSRQADEVGMLKQTFVNADVFEGMNCYTVLETIMQAVGATLFAWERKWFILPKRLIGNNISPHYYSSSFTHSSTLSPVGGERIIDKSNLYWINQDAQYKNLFAVGELSIEQDYSTNSNLVKSGAFTLDDFQSNNTLKEWRGTAQTFRRAHESDENKYSIAIDGQQDRIEDATSISTTGRTILNNIDGYLELSFKFNVIATDIFNSLFIPAVYIQVKAILLNPNNIEDSAGTELYLNGFGDWVSYEEYVVVKSEDLNKWQSFSQLSRFYYRNAKIEVSIFQPIMYLRPSGVQVYDIVETRFSDIKLEYLPSGDKMPKKRVFEFTNSAREFKNKNEDFNVKLGDGNSIIGYSLLDGVLYNTLQAPTKNWHREGVTEAWNLTDFVGARYLENYQQPTKSITGSIKHKNGSYLNPLDWYSAPNLNGIKFILNHFKWDVRRCAYNVELVENLAETSDIIDIGALCLENNDPILLENGEALLKN